MKLFTYPYESFKFYLANGLGILAFLLLSQWLVGPLILSALIQFMLIPFVLVLAMKLVDLLS